MCSTYQFFKDFAGPFATVVAAGAAAVITWTFASRQVRVAEQQAAIARQQAQTALDQLRHNLFERRYAIYSKTQDLIRTMLNRHHEKDFSAFELAPYHVAIKEARFFFPVALCQWLRALLDDDVKTFFETRTKPGSPEFLEASKKLLRRFEEMPDLFAPELEFRQLTQRHPVP
jgi:hypothetical protein